MKKFLALVLALVMTMSLVTISAGAEDFTDADKITYEEAVDVMTAIGVVGGYADGSFNPTAGLTRGAAAKIICNMILGPTTAEALVANEAPYSDVAVDNVFAGYIAYCANEGIISGYADGTFKPAAPLTGYAFMKMLLGALGYDAVTEGYVGTNWSIQVAKRALNIELDAGLVDTFVGSKALTREEACLYAFNTLKAEMVEYDVNSSITVGDIVISNSSKAEGTEKTFMSQFFKKLEEGTAASDKVDALGRPAITWYYDDEAVGTYAEAADYTLVNAIDEDDFTELFEDMDVDTNGKVAYTDTANGKTIELFFDADGEKVVKAVEIEAYLVEIDEADIADDKVSTKYDDRTVSVDGLKIKGTDEKKVAGVKVDNFEAIYEAAKAAVDADETLFVLLITDVDGKVFSVEIPEIVEAKVTRVKNDTITAGGVEYILADGVTATVGNDKLWVGENGCVYQAITKSGEESDVIYLDTYLEETTDKWGNKTYTAQIVNEEFQVVEWAVDVKTYEAGFYTYEFDAENDVYVLDAVDVVGDGVAMDKDKSYVNISGKKYFADDMVVVFIGETGKDLEVVVKEGVQDEIAGDHYVLSDDEVAIVYVLAAYEADDSVEVLFFKDFVADLEVEDLEGEKADAYIAYLDGEEVEVMVANAADKTAGFYTYKIDAETGKYTVTEKAGTVGSTDFVITQNKYITVGELDDVVVEGAIYDLTDEGLTTLKAINKWDSETEVATISFLYDTKEECITVLYVTFSDPELPTLTGVWTINTAVCSCHSNSYYAVGIDVYEGVEAAAGDLTVVLYDADGEVVAEAVSAKAISTAFQCNFYSCDHDSSTWDGNYVTAEQFEAVESATIFYKGFEVGSV